MTGRSFIGYHAMMKAICLVAALASRPLAPACAEEGKMLDSPAAHRLVSDWARTEGDDLQGFGGASNGDFSAKAASLGFQFDDARKTLIVRARVMPDAASLLKYQDIMQELQRIAREQSERMAGAQFELIHIPWDTGEQPTLYLRRSYQDAGASEAGVFADWRKLRETAYLWRRTYYGEAIGPRGSTPIGPALCWSIFRGQRHRAG